MLVLPTPLLALQHKQMSSSDGNANMHQFASFAGLIRAWYKSLARKGSFTAALDPKRLYAGAIHFVAIVGQRVQLASSTPDKHKQVTGH